MNIIVIDESLNFRKMIEEYMDVLGYPCYSFSECQKFYSWREEHAEVIVDFLFLSVSKDSDKNFTESIRVKNELKKNSFVSTVFILNDHIDNHYIKSLKYGDGYLLKPFSRDLLISSMNYHSKRTQLNDMLEKKNKKLLEYQRMVKREHDIVESIFSNHYDQHIIESHSVKSYISPASVFNGDILLTTMGPSGSLYVAVGDVTGHSLPAAIGAMPVYSIFRSMAKKGKNIGSIAAEMNRSLKGLLPDHMMMALTIIEVNFSSGKAFIWAGGLPDAVVVNKKGEAVRKIVSRHAPLTVLEPEKFRKDVDVVPLQYGRSPLPLYGWYRRGP